MIKKCIFAFCILALSAGAWSAEGVSNAFGIDNTAVDTRLMPPTWELDSPYDNDAGWGLLRGQLHCHRRPDANEFYFYVPAALSFPTLGAIGPGAAALLWEKYKGYKLTPDELAQRYKNAGFDFLAQTEHNEVSPESVSIPGITYAPYSDELTHNDGHILAIGTTNSSRIHGNFDEGTFTGNKVNDLSSRIQKVANTYGGLALIAHPDSRPYKVSSDEITKICKKAPVSGMNIYNSSWPGTECMALWDEVLGAGWWLWGYSEEDYHPYTPVIHRMGSAWVGVPGASDWTSIESNLRSGNYYSYWVTGGVWDPSDPVPLMKVTTPSNYEVRVDLHYPDSSPCSAKIEFVDQFGTWPGGTDSWSNTNVSGGERYIRVHVDQSLGWGRHLHIASQPIWVSPGGLRTQSMAQRGILGTSPELNLRYLGMDERPAPPPAGYIGDAFDVTADGQLPAGATLDLSYEGHDLSAIGGTQYLAIYQYDTGTSAWVKVGGTVNIGEALITAEITALGKYTISVDVPTDTTPAEVLFDSPYCGSVVVESTTVKVTVNDDLGPYQVSFFMNDHPLAQDADALDGWSVSLPITDYCTGDWTLKAVAEDLAGNPGEAEIPIYINSSTPRPTVSITSPTVGSSLSGSVTATGTCWDDISVAHVTLWANETLVGEGELDGSGAWSAEMDTTYLANGSRTLTAVVEDYPGNQASASIGVTINNGAVSIGDAKELADGQLARVNSLIVTAGTPEIGGAFYAETDDRFAGIRIATDRTVHEGDLVAIAGVLATDEGERQIIGSDVSIISSSNPLPPPLGMRNRTLGGWSLGPYAPGVWFSGLNNIGLLITAWGRVNQIGDGYLYINDGSALRDGTLTGTEENIGVRVICDPTDYDTGDYLIVTGISSCFETPSGLARRILTRRPSDIHKIGM